MKITEQDSSLIDKSTINYNITTSQTEQPTSPDGDTTHIDTTLESTTESSATTEHTALPPLPDYPRTYYTPGPKTTRNGTDRINSETSEIVALVIGVIAAILIAVILVILAILKFKSRGDRSYKVDDGKCYPQGPNAALLGNTSSTNGQTQYQVNGALRNGDKMGAQIQKKKRDSKDIKEWYV